MRARTRKPPKSPLTIKSEILDDANPEPFVFKPDNTGLVKTENPFDENRRSKRVVKTRGRESDYWKRLINDDYDVDLDENLEDWWKCTWIRDAKKWP